MGTDALLHLIQAAERNQTLKQTAHRFGDAGSPVTWPRDGGGRLRASISLRIAARYPERVPKRHRPRD